MQVIKVSDGLILIPHNKIEVSVLWLLSFFVKGYEKTYNVDAYPIGCRFKFDFCDL